MVALEERIERVARWCLRQGISVIPIGLNKVPAIKWTQYQTSTLDEWNFPGCNIGIVTGAFNKIVVVDCDSVASYAAWVKHRPPTPLRVRSKRGMHFYYQHPGSHIKNDSHVQAEEGFCYDVRGDGGYIMLPPSVRDGYQYQVCICRGNIHGRWLKPESLPVFDPAWRPERMSGAREWDSSEIRDIRAYIGAMYAVEGSGGDNRTFEVACKLAKSCETQLEAMALLSQWNLTNATPPWSIQELQRKLLCAYKECGNVCI